MELAVGEVRTLVAIVTEGVSEKEPVPFFDVVGNRVLAFGHDIFGEGKVDLPMAGGYIHATIPSVMRSFKLGSPTKIVGRFHQDEQTGALGDLATKARRVPVRIIVTDGNGEKRTFNFQIVHSIRFTPRMLRP